MLSPRVPITRLWSQEASGSLESRGLSPRAPGSQREWDRCRALGGAPCSLLTTTEPHSATLIMSRNPMTSQDMRSQRPSGRCD